MMRQQGHPIRVMIVEDHAMIARATARLVEEAGCTVVGPAPSVAEARKLAESERPDLSLVDMSLPDGSGEDLARSLVELGLKCAIVSGYERSEVSTALPAEIPWLQKPIEFEQLQALLESLH